MASIVDTFASELRVRIHALTRGRVDTSTCCAEPLSQLQADPNSDTSFNQVFALLAANNVPQRELASFKETWLAQFKRFRGQPLATPRCGGKRCFELCLHATLTRHKQPLTSSIAHALQRAQLGAHDKTSWKYIERTLTQLHINHESIQALKETWIALEAMPSTTLPSFYEVERHRDKHITLRPLAEADEPYLGTNEYRGLELDTAAKMLLGGSPLSILVAPPGWAVDRNHWLDSLELKLQSEGFASARVELRLANLRDARKRLQEREKQLLIVDAGDRTPSSWDKFLQHFLADEFFPSRKNARDQRVVLFVFDGASRDHQEAAALFVPLIRTLAAFANGRTNAIPTLGMNLKHLNPSQAGALLFGRAAWRHDRSPEMENIVSLLQEYVPLLPAIVAPLSEHVAGLRVPALQTSLAKAFAEGLAEHDHHLRPDPLHLVCARDNDFGQYDNRLYQWTREHTVAIEVMSPAFTTFATAIAAPLMVRR